MGWSEAEDRAQDVQGVASDSLSGQSWNVSRRWVSTSNFNAYSFTHRRTNCLGLGLRLYAANVRSEGERNEKTNKERQVFRG